MGEIARRVSAMLLFRCERPWKLEKPRRGSRFSLTLRTAPFAHSQVLCYHSCSWVVACSCDAYCTCIQMRAAVLRTTASEPNNIWSCVGLKKTEFWLEISNLFWSCTSWVFTECGFYIIPCIYASRRTTICPDCHHATQHYAQTIAATVRYGSGKKAVQVPAVKNGTGNIIVYHGKWPSTLCRETPDCDISTCTWCQILKMVGIFSDIAGTSVSNVVIVTDVCTTEDNRLPTTWCRLLNADRCENDSIAAAIYFPFLWHCK